MTKIRMLANDRGSEDGATVLRFFEGQEYEVGEALAEAFCDHRKTAERVTFATAAADAVAAAVDAASGAVDAVAEAVTGKSRKKAGDAPAA